MATEPRIARAFASRAAKLSGELTPWDGVLTAEAIEHLEKLRAHDRPFCPSALESYAECPHRFFLSSILRAEPVTEP